jgi:hypothetical protein
MVFCLGKLGDELKPNVADQIVTSSFYTEQNNIQPLQQDYADKGLKQVQHELDIIQQIDDLEENGRLKPSNKEEEGFLQPS